MNFLKTLSNSLKNMGTAPYDDVETRKNLSEATKRTMDQFPNLLEKYLEKRDKYLEKSVQHIDTEKKT